MLRSRLRLSLALGAFAAAFTMIAADIADARVRISIGSRGTRSFSAPPATRTVPTRPVERKATQPVAPSVIVVPRTTQRSASDAPAAPAAAAPSRPGFSGGLFGAGLVGVALGAGLTGGLGDLASYLGLALQIAIIAAIGWALLGLLPGRGRSPTQIPVRALQHPTGARSEFGLRNAGPR
jgi:hypothetical protein